MERNLASAVAVAKFAALLAFSILCITAAYSVANIDKHLSSTLMSLDDTLAKLNGKNGLIQEAGKTVVDTKNLIALSTLAEHKEISELDAWNNQFSASVTVFQQTLTQTRETLAAIQGTSEAATQTITALQAPITQATATLQAAQRSTEALQPVIGHLDALVSDPELRDTIAQTDATMTHLDATAADVQQEVYKYTHPGIWAKVKGLALDIAHVFNPL